MANDAEFTVSTRCVTASPNVAPVFLKVICISEPDAVDAAQWRIPNFSRIHVTKLHSDEFFCGGTPW